jgi:hypothetical protein
MPSMANNVPTFFWLMRYSQQQLLGTAGIRTITTAMLLLSTAYGSVSPARPSKLEVNNEKCDQILSATNPNSSGALSDIEKVIHCTKKHPTDEQYPLSISLTYSVHRKMDEAYLWAKIAYKTHETNINEFGEASNWKGFTALNLASQKFLYHLLTDEGKKQLTHPILWEDVVDLTILSGAYAGCSDAWIPGVSRMSVEQDPELDDSTKLGICIESAVVNMYSKRILSSLQGNSSLNLDYCKQIASIKEFISKDPNFDKYMEISMTTNLTLKSVDKLCSEAS